MDIYADTRKVVAIRLFQEDDGTWSVDGLDDENRHTESCWNFDTKQDALFAVAEFQRAIGTSTDRVITWCEATPKDSKVGHQHASAAERE